MAEQQFTFVACTDPKEGAIVYRNGERILRTTLVSDDPKHHNNLGRIVTDLLNNWEKSGRNTDAGAQKTRQSQDRSNVDVDRMEKITLAAADAKYLLNDFEQQFMSDQTARFLEYGQERIRFSPKQVKIMEDVAEKIGFE